MKPRNLFTLAALLAAGCASLNSGSIAGKQNKIYSSEVVKPEYGFKEIGCENSSLINENDYPKVSGDTLFIVGFSNVYSTERDAINDARLDGLGKIIGYVGKTEKNCVYSSFVSKTEIHELNQGGKIGYACHALMKIPMSDFTEESQKELRNLFSR